jgi:hypothetical protein
LWFQVRDEQMTKVAVTLICPVGIFFDINPSHRRDLFKSPCHHFVRISFGPPMEDLVKGLDGFERILKRAKEEGVEGFGWDYEKSPVT